jgi:hypothetical protein
MTDCAGSTATIRFNRGSFRAGARYGLAAPSVMLPISELRCRLLPGNLTRRANHRYMLIIEEIVSPHRETGRGFFESNGVAFG